VSYRFIHVGFHFNGDAPIEALKVTFNSAKDWARYDKSCWILYTSTGLETWRDRIRNTPGVQPNDSFFLSEFEANYSGYMHDWVWEWLKKDRST
jgi:hypothetical protein